MAVDKLVDSTQLDIGLTSVANAIRSKSGGSSQLAFPAGFVSEIGNIPTGSGSSMQSGSVTLASDTTVFTVSLTAEVTHFVFYVSDFPDGKDDVGWNTVGGVWANNYCWEFIRYNNANYNSNQAQPVTSSSSSISITAGYKIASGKTVNWFAW